MCLDNPLHVSNHSVGRPNCNQRSCYGQEGQTQCGFDNFHLSLNERTFNYAKTGEDANAPFIEIELMTLESITSICQWGEVCQFAFGTERVG